MAAWMPRYAALLRGVSPMNCKMEQLRRALEAARFERVVTVLSSGNAVFDTDAAPPAELERRVEAATEAHLGRGFDAIVRPVTALEALLSGDPFAPFAPRSAEKRVVTFLKATPSRLPRLPASLSKARVVALDGQEAFTLYEREEAGPVFMTLIERTFGEQLTTRTWDTVAKIAAR